ncbi:hypothetical protein SH501x_001914 [Pirellulaceae bacterium SH501]
MHPSREVGRFEMDNFSSRPGDCRRYPNEAMTLTLEQQGFVDAIRKPKNSHRALLLEKRFHAIPRDERLDALLYLFSSANDHATQQDCSRFLPLVVSDCMVPIDDILVQIASTWNLSVEELPNFLADVYGAEIVIGKCSSLALQFNDDSYERRAMETIAWWLQRRVERDG